MKERPTIGNLFDLEKTVTSICNPNFLSMNQEKSLADAMELMVKKPRGKLFLEQSNQLTGILTFLDILDALGGGRKHSVYKKYRKSPGMKLERIMSKPLYLMEDTSIEKAFYALRRFDTGSLPIVDKGKKITGVLSGWEFVKNIKGRTGVTAAEAMTRKPLVSKKDYTLYETAKMMCRGAYKNFPVTEKGILVGSISPFLIVNHLHGKSRANYLQTEKTKIGSIMDITVPSIPPGADMSEAIREMRANGVRPVFVTEDRELKGIITKRDLLEVIS